MPRTSKGRFTWADVTSEHQKALLDIIGGDGHTIWSADALKEDGVSPAIVDTFTTVEKSDGTLKGSIFTDHGVAPELRGVYGLTVILLLAHHHGVTSNKFGRGSEARELTEKILAKLSGDES